MFDDTDFGFPVSESDSKSTKEDSFSFKVRQKLAQKLLNGVHLQNVHFGTNSISMSPGGVDKLQFADTGAVVADTKGDIYVDSVDGKIRFFDTEERTVGHTDEIAGNPADLGTLLAADDGSFLRWDGTDFVGAEGSLGPYVVGTDEAYITIQEAVNAVEATYFSVNITNAAVGLTTNAADVDAGVTFTILTEGDATTAEVTRVAIAEATDAYAYNVSPALHWTLNSAADATPYYVWYNITNEISTITTIASPTDETFFWLFTSTTSHYFWMDNDGSGTIDPNPAAPGGAPAPTSGHAIDLSGGAGATDVLVAAAIQSVVDALTFEFTATVLGAVVTVTTFGPGDVTDAVDGTAPTTFTIATALQADPAPGGTGIQVDILAYDDDADVAAATATAITALGDFGATNDQITVATPIFIKPGTYGEDVTIARNYVGLVGLGARSAGLIVVGNVEESGSGGVSIQSVTVDADVIGATFQNLEMKNAAASTALIITAGAATGTVATANNCLINASTGTGFTLGASAALVLNQCRVRSDNGGVAATIAGFCYSENTLWGEDNPYDESTGIIELTATTSKFYGRNNHLYGFIDIQAAVDVCEWVGGSLTASLDGAVQVATVDVSSFGSNNANATDLNDDYIILHTPENKYFAWFNTNGAGTEPTVPGYTAVAVILETADTDQEVSDAIVTALNALDDMTVGNGATTTVTITNITAGDVKAPFDTTVGPDPGFTHAVTTAGAGANVIFSGGTVQGAGDVRFLNTIFRANDDGTSAPAFANTGIAELTSGGSPVTLNACTFLDIPTSSTNSPAKLAASNNVTLTVADEAISTASHLRGNLVDPALTLATGEFLRWDGSQVSSKTGSLGTFVVGANELYTTIQAGLDAVEGLAPSVLTPIFIQPGTYTENLTLKPKAVLVGLGGFDVASSVTAPVRVVGNHTYGTGDEIGFQGIEFVNSANASDVFALSAGSTTVMRNCRVNQSNAGTAESNVLDFTGTLASIAENEYFWIYTRNVSHYFWYDIGGAPADPTPTPTVGKPITTSAHTVDISAAGTDNAVAIATAAVIDALAMLSAPVPGGDTVTVTYTDVGEVDDAEDGAGGDGTGVGFTPTDGTSGDAINSTDIGASLILVDCDVLSTAGYALNSNGEVVTVTRSTITGPSKFATGTPDPAVTFNHSDVTGNVFFAPTGFTDQGLRVYFSKLAGTLTLDGDSSALDVDTTTIGTTVAVSNSYVSSEAVDAFNSNSGNTSTLEMDNTTFDGSFTNTVSTNFTDTTYEGTYSNTSHFQGYPVSTTPPTAGQVLSLVGGVWTPTAASAISALPDMTDVIDTVTSGAALGTYLRYDTGGNEWINAEGSLGTYVVGTNEAYTTIQLAVDALEALNGGTGPTNPTPVFIKPGVYAENVSIEKDNIGLVGLGAAATAEYVSLVQDMAGGSVQIESVKFDSSILATGIQGGFLENVYLNNTAGAGATASLHITTPSTGSNSISIRGCVIEATSGDAINVADSSTILHLWNCVASTDDGGTALTGGTVVANQCQFGKEAPTGVEEIHGLILLDSEFGSLQAYQCNQFGYTNLSSTVGGVNFRWIGGRMENNQQGTISTLTVTTPASATLDTAGAGDYWTFETPEAAYYVWYDVNSLNTDPGVDGRIGVEVDVGAAVADTVVAEATRDALNALSTVGTATVVGAIVTIPLVTFGSVPAPNVGATNTGTFSNLTTVGGSGECLRLSGDDGNLFQGTIELINVDAQTRSSPIVAGTRSPVATDGIGIIMANVSLNSSDISVGAGKAGGFYGATGFPDPLFCIPTYFVATGSTSVSASHLADNPMSYTFPTDGQAITWNDADGKWEPSTIADATTLPGLTDVIDTVTSAAVAGNVLRYDGAEWVNSNPDLGPLVVGGTPRVTTLDLTGETPTIVTGEYFILHDDGGSVEVWFSTASTPAAAPGGVSTRDLEITLDTYPDTIAGLQSALSNGLFLDQKYMGLAGAGALFLVSNTTLGVTGTSTIGTTSFGSIADAEEDDGGFPYTDIASAITDADEASFLTNIYLAPNRFYGEDFTVSKAVTIIGMTNPHRVDSTGGFESSYSKGSWLKGAVTLSTVNAQLQDVGMFGSVEITSTGFGSVFLEGVAILDFFNVGPQLFSTATSSTVVHLNDCHLQGNAAAKTSPTISFDDLGAGESCGLVIQDSYILGGDTAGAIEVDSNLTIRRSVVRSSDEAKNVILLTGITATPSCLLEMVSVENNSAAADSTSIIYIGNVGYTVELVNVELKSSATVGGDGDPFIGSVGTVTVSASSVIYRRFDGSDVARTAGGVTLSVYDETTNASHLQTVDISETAPADGNSLVYTEQAQTFTVTTIAPGLMTASSSFDFYTASTGYRVWYDTTGADAAPDADGLTLAEVDVSAAGDADAVAVSTAAIITVLGGVTATAAGGTASPVTVVNNAVGKVGVPTDGVGSPGTGFTLAVTVAGKSEWEPATAVSVTSSTIADTIENLDSSDIATQEGTLGTNGVDLTIELSDGSAQLVSSSWIFKNGNEQDIFTLDGGFGAGLTNSFLTISAELDTYTNNAPVVNFDQGITVATGTANDIRLGMAGTTGQIDAQTDLTLTTLDVNSDINIAAGATTGIVAVTGLEFDVTLNTIDFNSSSFASDAGLQAAVGSTQINIGTTAGQIDSAGDLFLLATTEMWFTDTNQAASTVVQAGGLKFSDTAAEWTAYEVAFPGEVSILSAITTAATSYTTVTGDSGTASPTGSDTLNFTGGIGIVTTVTEPGTDDVSIAIATDESVNIAGGGGVWSFSPTTLQVTGIPSATTDAVNKAYVDNVAQGLDVKDSCRVATTTVLGSTPVYTNINGVSGNGQLTFTGGPTTIDGVTLANDDRILVKDEGGGTSEVHSVDTVDENITGLNNDYWVFYTTPNHSFHVWYNVSGGVDPNPGGSIAIEVVLVAADGDDVVATKTKAAIDAFDFSGEGGSPTVVIAGANSNEMTITNAQGGDVPIVAEGVGTGFTFATDTPGTGISADANGIWVRTSATTWDRAIDFDEDTEVTASAFTFVEEGTANADSGWTLATNNVIIIGGTDGSTLTWVQFSGAGQVVAGFGITKSANTISVDVADDFSTSGGGPWTSAHEFDSTVQFDGVVSGTSTVGAATADAIEIGSDLIPTATGTLNCGDATNKWALVRAVTVTSGDHVFEHESNGGRYRVTEHPTNGLMIQNTTTGVWSRIVTELCDAPDWENVDNS